MQSTTVLFVLLVSALVIVDVRAWDVPTIPARVPPTKGTLRTNFLITANGVTDNGLFSFNIKNNVGTFDVRGKKYISAGYYTQGTLPIGTDGARWVDFIGISENNDDLAWIVFQCEPIVNATTIEAVYEEDYTHQGVADPCNAVCNFVDLSGQPDAVIPVQLPAVTSVPVAGAVDSNVTILGSQVYLDHAGPGWIIIDSKVYITVPINNIPCPNCGGNCETCLRSPWYESHVVFYDVDATELGFGIFYLYPYNRTFVQFNYTLMLPSLKTPAITFDAVWTGNPMGDDLPLQASHPLPHKQPPPHFPEALKKHGVGRPQWGKSIFSPVTPYRIEADGTTKRRTTQ